MSKLDELYRLHRLLDGRRTPMPRAHLIGAHGFARATLGRLIADLRYKLGAPLIHDKDRAATATTPPTAATPCPGYGSAPTNCSRWSR